jgi:hypothetical protein
MSAELISAELISAELMSAELMSAELMSAELMSAELKSAELAIAEGTGLVEDGLRPRPLASCAFSSSLRSYPRSAPSRLTSRESRKRASLDAL